MCYQITMIYKRPFMVYSLWTKGVGYFRKYSQHYAKSRLRMKINYRNVPWFYENKVITPWFMRTKWLPVKECPGLAFVHRFDYTSTSLQISCNWHGHQIMSVYNTRGGGGRGGEGRGGRGRGEVGAGEKGLTAGYTNQHSANNYHLIRAGCSTQVHHHTSRYTNNVV